jgi:hypothetical protein
MTVILVTQEAQIRRISFQSQPWKVRPYFEKKNHKNVLVEWLNKLEHLPSKCEAEFNPRATKKVSWTGKISL